MPLIGMNVLEEMVHTTLLTGNLATDKSVSLLLIAKPESGKTTVLNERRNKNVAICSDMTGNGLADILLDYPNARHVVINDMIALMAHKDHVRSRTLALLNQATEEGLFKIAMPGKGEIDFNGRRIGFICCIPSTIVADERMWWNRSGFASRLLPFYYDLSEKLVIQIKRESIVRGTYESNGNVIKLPLPTRQKLIQIPGPLAGDIQRRADIIAERLGSERGFRRGKQLRALVRAHALRAKRTAVTNEDIDFLERVSPFISYTTPGEFHAEKRR